MTAHPNWQPGESGNRPGRPKGKSVGKWLAQLGNEDFQGKPKAQHIAERLIQIAMDPSTEPDTVLKISTFMTERLDGKPVQANINVEAEFNPFSDVDTSTLEKLQARLIEMKKDGGDKQL